MKRALPAIAGLVLAACSTTQAVSAPAIGSPPLCSPGVRLGAVAVAPLTHWRPDQADREARAEIARKAIEAAFRSTPCAASVKVLAISSDADAPAKLVEAKTGGADTAVLIRIDEVGPIPAARSTWTDIRFTLGAVDLASGRTRLKVDHHRKVGDPFQVRGVDRLQAEMETALHDVITGPAVK